MRKSNDAVENVTKGEMKHQNKRWGLKNRKLRIIFPSYIWNSNQCEKVYTYTKEQDGGNEMKDIFLLKVVNIDAFQRLIKQLTLV